MAKSRGKKKKGKVKGTPVIENRKARYQYAITDTLEAGIMLVGTEVKSIRDGQVSIAEGFVRVDNDGRGMYLHGMTINEYAPAGGRQHESLRRRKLLAHGAEIRKMLKETSARGVTIVPLKLYFNDRGIAKVLIGVAHGKGKADRREDMAKRDAERDMRRAMSKRR